MKKDSFLEEKPSFFNNLLIPGFLISLAFALQQFTVNSGVGLTYDSYMYLKSALAIREEGILQGLTYRDFTVKPPLYALILAAVPFKYIGLFNGICLIISLSLFYWLLQKIFSNHLIRISCFFM